jgi:hypothetical protein
LLKTLLEFGEFPPWSYVSLDADLADVEVAHKACVAVGAVIVPRVAAVVAKEVAAAPGKGKRRWTF